MTDCDDPKFSALLHLRNGTMLSAEAVTAICKWAVERDAVAAVLEKAQRDAVREYGFDANGSDAP